MPHPSQQRTPVPISGQAGCRSRARLLALPYVSCLLAAFVLNLSSSARGCGLPQAQILSQASRGADHDGDPRVRVPGAQRTIALKMPAFKRCFEQMNASGRVALMMIIVPDGVVTRAHVDGPVPRPVASCIESHALDTVFSEPEGGRTARLLVPVSVIKQPI